MSATQMFPRTPVRKPRVGSVAREVWRSSLGEFFGDEGRQLAGVLVRFDLNRVGVRVAMLRPRRPDEAATVTVRDRGDRDDAVQWAAGADRDERSRRVGLPRRCGITGHARGRYRLAMRERGCLLMLPRGSGGVSLGSREPAPPWARLASRWSALGAWVSASRALFPSNNCCKGRSRARSVAVYSTMSSFRSKRRADAPGGADAPAAPPCVPDPSAGGHGPHTPHRRLPNHAAARPQHPGIRNGTPLTGVAFEGRTGSLVLGPGLERARGGRKDRDGAIAAVPQRQTRRTTGVPQQRRLR